MGLFRKHQRAFLLVTASLTISSFLFFGVSNSLQSSQDPDPVIGKAIDGSAILRSDVMTMVHFFQGDPLLNDRFIAQDLLETGMGTMIVERYQDEILQELQFSLSRARNFTPYVHPEVKELSQEAVWREFHPELFNNYQKIQSTDYSCEKSFDLLSKLYLQQERFSPELVRQIIGFGQKRSSQTAQDPYLQQRDFHLFGFHTLEEWFGHRFLELTAELLINASIVAESKGYNVSYEEALADLVFRLKEAQEISYKESGALLSTLAQRSGLGEKRTIKMWQKVMLFRRLFQEVGNTIFIDSLTTASFSSYAHQSVQLELYRMAPDVKLTSFRDLLKFQVYLEAVSGKQISNAELPTLSLSPLLVEKEAPELVYRTVVADTASVTTDEVAHAFSLEEIWGWELDEVGYALVQKESAALPSTLTRAERFAALESLDNAERREVDARACAIMMERHPERLFKALQAKTGHSKRLLISSSGNAPVFDSVSTPFFLKLLQNREALKFFTEDGKTYYRMEIKEEGHPKEIFSFRDAEKNGALDLLLDRVLESAYPSVRKQDPAPFKTEAGYRPYEEVRDEIGARLYSKLLRNLGKYEDLDQYARVRFVPHLEKIYREIEKKADSLVLHLFSPLETDPLRRQLSLVKSEQEVTRAGLSPFDKEKVFALEEGSFSPLEGREGDPFFYQVKKQRVSPSLGESKIAERDPLSIDAQRGLMHDLLELCARRT